MYVKSCFVRLWCWHFVSFSLYKQVRLYFKLICNWTTKTVQSCFARKKCALICKSCFVWGPDSLQCAEASHVPALLCTYLQWYCIWRLVELVWPRGGIRQLWSKETFRLLPDQLVYSIASGFLCASMWKNGWL